MSLVKNEPTATKRLFIALTIPKNLHAVILEAQKQLLPYFKGKLNWCRPEQFHLTLQFLGQVAIDRIPELSQILKSVGKNFISMDLSLGALGAFPHFKNPRILWISVEDGSHQLQKLQQNIKSLTDKFCERIDKRGFQPHLTLARIKERQKFSGTEKTFLEIENNLCTFPRDWKATDLKLIESQTLASGSIYHTLESITLSFEQTVRKQ